MNAIQPSRPPLKPVEPKRVNSHRKHQLPRRRPYRLVALETTAKLVVNVVISAIAVSALVQLLPYTWRGQEKLQEIQTEVDLREENVNRLRTDLSYYFDPQQAKSVMQEQSLRFEPDERQVILLDKTAKTVQAKAEQSH